MCPSVSLNNFQSFFTEYVLAHSRYNHFISCPNTFIIDILVTIRLTENDETGGMEFDERNHPEPFQNYGWRTKAFWSRIHLGLPELPGSSLIHSRIILKSDNLSCKRVDLESSYHKGKKIVTVRC